jgi:ring-1,2-phenylacetyl-CoA epoxidase subunit PaaE
MSAAPQFHALVVSSVDAQATNAVTLSFHISAALQATFAFEPGQFLTLRATIDGQDVRRSYSICSSPQTLTRDGVLQVGIRAVEGGLFSNWATTQLKTGDILQVMPPQGRFGVKHARARHRVGFAAGSGITPILSIMASTLHSQPDSKFTLVYGNRHMASVMFNEALQDLKDRYTDRLTLIHILSRQAQEVPLLEGRIEGDKVRAIIAALLPVQSMDEVFVCGPEAMIEATEAALMDAGVPANRVHSERFTASTSTAPRKASVTQTGDSKKAIQLRIILDGKPYELTMDPDEHVLDVALQHGLDLPYSCKAGVCCTCRAKVMEGQVEMSKNFTLEPWEMAQGFVLSCQACPTTASVVVSFDER